MIPPKPKGTNHIDQESDNMRSNNTYGDVSDGCFFNWKVHNLRARDHWQICLSPSRIAWLRTIKACSDPYHVQPENKNEWRPNVSTLFLLPWWRRRLRRSSDRRLPFLAVRRKNFSPEDGRGPLNLPPKVWWDVLPESLPPTRYASPSIHDLFHQSCISFYSQPSYSHVRCHLQAFLDVQDLWIKRIHEKIFFSRANFLHLSPDIPNDETPSPFLSLLMMFRTPAGGFLHFLLWTLSDTLVAGFVFRKTVASKAVIYATS